MVKNLDQKHSKKKSEKSTKAKPTEATKESVAEVAQESKAESRIESKPKPAEAATDAKVKSADTTAKVNVAKTAEDADEKKTEEVKAKQKNAKDTTGIREDAPEVATSKKTVSAEGANAKAKDAKAPKERKVKRQKTPRASARGKHPMPAAMRILCTILFLAMVSIFITWFVIWRTNMCEADKAMEFIREKPDLALYNYILIFALLAVGSAITWRPFFTVGLGFAIASIITFAHMQKYELRAEPLLPEEFQLADAAGDMMQFVDMDSVWRLVFGVVFVIVGSILLEFYVRKLMGRSLRGRPLWDRWAIIPRVTFSVMAVTLLLMIADPILHRRDTEWIEGVDLIAWNQGENYDANGFVIGFLYNLGNNEATMPQEYNEATMREIAKKYRAEKAADTIRVKLGEEVENVVVILAETFYDPALLTKHYDYYGGDVTPNLHAIFKKYPSGYMYSPEYGGGTANVEFEVQTGLSNFWAQTFPYVNKLAKMDSLLGVASWAKDAGFDTTAIHSYKGAMYKRNIVYPKIGYDEFIDADEMEHQEHEYDSPLINDRSIYAEILDILESSDEPKLIGAVTMQNHAPYQQANYPELEFRLKQPSKDAWAVEPSYQSLHESDHYLGEFIEALDELDEKTVVLWFGDHAMGLLNDYVYSDDVEDQRIAHMTPYFVYANFEIESPYTVTETEKLNAQQGLVFPSTIRGINLPTTSPNCLQNTMYNILNAEKPALFYLLDDVCTQTPILTRSYYAKNSPTLSQTLRDYELVNYDALNGKHYWDGD